MNVLRKAPIIGPERWCIGGGYDLRILPLPTGADAGQIRSVMRLGVAHLVPIPPGPTRLILGTLIGLGIVALTLNIILTCGGSFLR